METVECALGSGSAGEVALLALMPRLTLGEKESALEVEEERYVAVAAVRWVVLDGNYRCE
jgi:hypothetical protein